MFILNRIDTGHIEKDVIIDNKLQVRPFSYWKQYDVTTWLNFMLKNGYYIIPTTELIDCLRTLIIGSAIDIGAGNGFLGRALGIPITDSKLQEDPSFQLYYKLAGQPVTYYPNDVEKIDAVDAIKKYKPDTVLGSYITCKYNEKLGMGNFWGVDDQFVVQNCKRYIMVGNKSVEVHKKNPLMERPHEEHYFDWLITRASDQEEGRIFVWTNQ